MTCKEPKAGIFMKLPVWFRILSAYLMYLFVLAGPWLFMAPDLRADEQLAGPEESNEIWEPLFHSDFESEEMKSPEKPGWSTYTDVNPVTFPWGVTDEGFESKSSIYLKQSDDPSDGCISYWLSRLGLREKKYKSCWLHTGPGTITYPPSAYFNYYGMMKTFQKPWMSEFRVGFLLKESTGEPGVLYVDDVELALWEPAREKDGQEEVFISDLEKVRIAEPETYMWSIFSKKGSDNLTWGISDESHGGRNCIFLQQKKLQGKGLFLKLQGSGSEEERMGWLFTGTGELTEPPSRSGDTRWRIETTEAVKGRLTAKMRGQGNVGLYVWWYDQEMNASPQYLGDYFLPENYKELEKEFALPGGPVQGRLSVYAKGAGTAVLYLWWYDKQGEGHDLKLGRYSLSESYREITSEFLLPKEAEEFRVVFTMAESGQSPSTLYVDDLNVALSVADRNMGSERVWYPLMASGPESGMSGKQGSLKWSTYSEGRSELTQEAHEGEHALYLGQPDSRDYWLYSGPGEITKAPGAYFDNRWKLKKTGSTVYRISASLKGEGAADLYVWWYDASGKSFNMYLGRYFLPASYKTMIKEFSFPEDAREYRIGFLLKGNDKGGLSNLYVRDVQIEYSVVSTRKS